jgi:cellobiose phosphorylase
MNPNDILGWEFIDETGMFRLPNPDMHNYLYMPLVNDAGIFSSITPTFHGDIKADHNTYLTAPVSVENLHDSRAARNFWVQAEGKFAWSATGNSADQVARHFTDDEEETVLEAGFLWQRVKRINARYGLQAVVTSFVPCSNDRVELMKITITNLSNDPLMLSATAAIPIYGRSAENLRDHRHVTSLLHRTRCGKYGVLVSPTLSFDERGHQTNKMTYMVLGMEQDGKEPDGFFPVMEDFIGEGGSLDWPDAVIRARVPEYHAGMSVDGFESIGGIRFRAFNLPPAEARSFILIMAIMEEDGSDRLVKKYGNDAKFMTWFEKTIAFWRSQAEMPRISCGNARFEGWLRWVTVQPLLRRNFGNSFLPYHDYGRGGRGWRDLWQDCLALLISENGDVGRILLDNFGGVRIDGSNATIIGTLPGEFKADRNNIPRVWMDHGVWPLLTTELYLNQTGDLGFLLNKQVYFKDRLAARARQTDDAWSPEQGTVMLASGGEVYKGTVLEHILVQHLVQFFNVGEHNSIKLEGADWNDAMDMANQRGESVAFTGLYAGNLQKLSEWALDLKKLGVLEVELASELLPLLDTLSKIVDYDSVAAKQSRLEEYFSSCKHTISGNKIALPLDALAADLAAKANWMRTHLRNSEWLVNAEGFGWFNGYYDNNGMRVEGDFPQGVRMTLTGQVFALMGCIANEAQASEIVRSVDRYLYDAKLGGVRLNTNFGELYPALGRAFGFAYGHKENGAMFSHMAIMYACALYQRKKVKAAYKILREIYDHCQDFRLSRIYPGIPEYINERGRGMYTYLTGSASWYLLTLINESFGVRGLKGDLEIEPKLCSEQFDQGGMARLITQFADKKIEFVYNNHLHLDYGDYRIFSARMDDEPVQTDGSKILILRSRISKLDSAVRHCVEIDLR